MRRCLQILLVALLSACLIGCQAISEAVLNELEAVSQPSERSLEIQAAATVAATPMPALTPAAEATPRGRVLTEAEPTPEALPTLPPLLAKEQADEPDAGLTECALIWNLMSGGQALADEWYAWIANDPPSPQAHLLELEQFARRWEAHATRVAAAEVAAESEPVREAYFQAVRAYWGSTLLARDALQRGDQRMGPQARELAEQANDLWYEAYDQIDALCRVAFAAGAPLPRLRAEQTPQPTAPPQ